MLMSIQTEADNYWCDDCEDRFTEPHKSQTGVDHLVGAQYGPYGAELEQQARDKADATRYRFLREHPFVVAASQGNDWDKMIDEAIKRAGP